MRVLEIGSGTGEYTGSILENGSNVTASDISPNCIKLIENKKKRGCCVSNRI